MRRLSTGRRLLFDWRAAWFVRSRRCAEHCNTTATPSDLSTDATCGVLFGNAAQQRMNCLNRPFRRRAVRVVLDGQLSGEYLGEVDLDSGADCEEQFAVGGGQFHTGRCT